MHIIEQIPPIYTYEFSEVLGNVLKEDGRSEYGKRVDSLDQEVMWKFLCWVLSSLGDRYAIMDLDL